MVPSFGADLIGRHLILFRSIPRPLAALCIVSERSASNACQLIFERERHVPIVPVVLGRTNFTDR